MLKEVIIWPDEENKSFDKGKFFEKLANDVFSSQRFKVDGNIQYTGREFDLECRHLDRTNERCLVECKAKQNLSTTEIRNFVFNVEHQKFNYGFFLYTRKYEKQVGGLINELKEDEDGRYKNIYFWNADKVIELLVESGAVKDFSIKLEDYEVNKLILFYSHLGIYYIALLTNSTIPSHFCVFDAKKLTPFNDEKVISEIKSFIEELTPLEFIKNGLQNSSVKNHDVQLETVAEIQEADSWDDYKPASVKYFVGRKKQREKLFNYLNDVRKHKTSKRIFYVDGKSGWGKSSLMNDLKGRCRNKFYKNRFFSLVVDSRSANSHNFLPLTYRMILNKSSNIKFIPEEYSKIIIPSSFDVLGDQSTKRLCAWLEENDKLLVIVFDQFEDVFRKERIFKSFYKFLIDINNLNSNIILGFSWKSEINIPIEHEAYHLWQQSKDHAFQITLDEFDAAESKAIIKQLEADIAEKFDTDFIRKIIDNSQGYPWLVKKLCIHIKRQYEQGVDIESLYDQDFQVEPLFKRDLEELNANEVKALRYIANRAYKDQSLDVTELDEVVSGEIIQQLVHKRYVIKSGTKYNIYWDIFRDYLVLNEVPPIGETYLIRQPVRSVFEAFITFSNKTSLSIDEFISLIPNDVAEGAALNLLRELRSLGLITYKNGVYFLKGDSIEVSEDSFKDYIHEKLQKHSFTMELKKIEGKEIVIKDIANIIKSKIRTKNFADKTLETYSQLFLGWIDFAGIEIPNVSSNTLRRAKNALSYTPQMYPEDVEQYLLSINNKSLEEKSKRDDKLLYDLKSLGLIRYSRNQVQLTELGMEACRVDESSRKKIISDAALKMEKIRYSYDMYASKPGIKSIGFKSLISEVLDGLNSQIYINRTSRALYLWSSYIHAARQTI